MEAKSTRNPPVPRAPRAKARCNSVGSLSREMKSANSSLNSICSRASESRRPTNESPFSHARVCLLDRERNAVENQMFEMGPRIRSSSVEVRKDFARGNRLAQESSVNEGMPWQQPKEEDVHLAPKGRCHTLKHERRAADQALEWVPAQAAKPARGDGESDVRSHARVNIYAREVGNAAQTLEISPMVQVRGLQGDTMAAVGDKDHGRRNVLARETADESLEAPIASGFSGGSAVPSYGRRAMLPPPVPRSAMAY